MTYDISDVIDAVSPAVVQISDAAGGTALGTGFLVNESGFVVTAHHVINDLGGRATVGVAVPNYEDEKRNRISGNFVLFQYDVVAADEAHDLAVLGPHEEAGNPFREPRPTETMSKWYAWMVPALVPMLNAMSGTGVAMAKVVTAATINRMPARLWPGLSESLLSVICLGRKCFSRHEARPAPIPRR